MKTSAPGVLIENTRGNDHPTARLAGAWTGLAWEATEIVGRNGVLDALLSTFANLTADRPIEEVQTLLTRFLDLLPEFRLAVAATNPTEGHA